MENAPRSKALLIIILGALTALSPFSIDMYLPAFPKIAENLNSTVAQVALSLSSYFIGLSVGQLIYGPLLDRFGRKKPLYAGLVIYILASLGCLISYNIETLVFVRLLQALGGCAAGVASMAMVRDNFTMKESSKVFSLLILILGTSPLIAPTLGGYVSVAFGWHSVFVILAAIAFLLLLTVIFFLKENYQPDPTVSLRAGPIFRNFISIFKNPQFSTYSVSSALAFAGLFVYVAGSPVIFMQIFKVEPQTYGWIFAFLSIGFIGASQVNILLIRHFRNEDIFFCSILGQVLTTVVFAVGAFNGWFGVGGTVAMLFLLLACVGTANPNGGALAMAPFSKNAGSAAALMGFVQMGAGALASMSISIFNANELFPITAIFASASALALFVLVLGKRRITDQIEASNDAGTIVSH